MNQESEMVSAAKAELSSAEPVGDRSLRVVPKNADAHIGLVKRVAYNMARRLPSRVDVRDLISSGTIGLLDAMSKYDPDQNDNFEAYAEIRIRGAILDELRGLDWVPRSVRQKTHTLEKLTHQLEGEFGRAPSDDEMAKAMKLSLEQYYEFTSDVRSISVLSLEDLISGSGAPPQTGEEYVEPSPLEQLCRRATASAVAGGIESLPERERLVLSLYYLEGLKLKEIGDILGVTESRVCQIHGHAIERLKTMLTSEAG